jgi:hypothetical protein
VGRVGFLQLAPFTDKTITLIFSSLIGYGGAAKNSRAFGLMNIYEFIDVF